MIFRTGNGVAMRKIWLICFIISTVFLGISSYAASSGPSEITDLFNQGIQAEQAGDYEKAVELFRQVVFLDGADVKAQFFLAESLEKAGHLGKALREYKTCRILIRHDTRLTEEERKKFAADTQTAIDMLTAQRKQKHRFTFLDINIFILTIISTILLLVRLGRWLRYVGRRPEEEKKLKKICLDQEWIEEKENEFCRFPLSCMSIGMLIVTGILYFLSFKILFL